MNKRKALILIKLLLAVGVLVTPFAVCEMAKADGLHLSAKGVPSLCDNALTRPSTILESCGRQDPNGNLFDISGENGILYSEQLDQWTKRGACTVTADQLRAPDGTLTADYIQGIGSAGVDDLYQVKTGPWAGGEALGFRFSIYVPANIAGTLRVYHPSGNAYGRIDIDMATIPVNRWFEISTQSIENFSSFATLVTPFVANGNTAGYALSAGSGGPFNVYLWGMQQWSQRADGSWRSPYHTTAANDKPWIDLAPTNGPTWVHTGTQDQTGNPLDAFRLVSASSQCFTASSDPYHLIWDQDFTLTVFARISSVATSSGYFLGKGAFQSNGGYFYWAAGTHEAIGRLNKVGATCDSNYDGLATLDDDMWHVFHWIRRSDMTYVCIDGACGTPTNCSGYGTSGSNDFHYGANPFCSSAFADEDTMYYRWDSDAITPEDFADDLSALQGLNSNVTVPPVNVIADGTMEAAGTTSWTAQNDAVLTKTTAGVHGGTQALRITYGGTAAPIANQTSVLNIGQTYRVTGFARADGNGVVTPYIQIGSIYPWTGTTSSSWQAIDTLFVADGVTFRLRANGAAVSGAWAEFDDVVVQKFEPFVYTFTRSTVGWLMDATGRLIKSAANTPRVGGDGGGVLIEAQSQNLEDYTDFSSGWGLTNATMPSCASLDPTGGSTACVLHEDATAGVPHSTNQVFTATSGTAYTCSIYVKAANRNYVRLHLSGGGGAILNNGSYFNVKSGALSTNLTATTRGIEPAANGFYRVWVGAAAASSGTAYCFVYASDDTPTSTFNGADQDSLYLFAPQVETGLFPTSFITSAAGTQVIRTADSLTFDPHPTGGQLLLPEEFDGTGYLTMEFDAKCEWSGSTDIGTAARYFIDIGGNTGTSAWNRNRFVYFVNPSGILNVFFYDNATTVHNLLSAANPVDFSEWHTYKTKYNFSDLSDYSMTIDGVDVVSGAANMSGTGTWDTSGNLIRFGQTNGGVVNGFCRFKNIRIEPREF